MLTDARPPTEPQALQPAMKPGILQSVRTWMRDFFLGDDPSFFVAIVPYCLLSMLLFTRHPRTNFIFDEQEALVLSRLRGGEFGRDRRVELLEADAGIGRELALHHSLCRGRQGEEQG